MTRSPVSSEFVTEPKVVRALREHATERSTILARLAASFQEDQHIRAAWLWGSFLRGDQDDLSDLDIWLLVAPCCVGGFAILLEKYCRAAGLVIACGENAHNAPQGGGYFNALLAGSHGLHHLDIYWQVPSDAIVPDGPVLFNRLNEPCPDFEWKQTKPDQSEESDLDNCRGRITFVWLMLSVAAKCLARDPSSDMALMSYPRNAFDETVEVLGLKGQVGEVNWTTTGGSFEKVELLRQVSLKTAILEGACRDRGLDISSEANPCLNRYFDLVERILSKGL